MDPPALSRCSALGADDVELATRRSSSTSSSTSTSPRNKASIPSEQSMDLRAALAATNSSRSNNMRQEEEKASLDEDGAVFGTTTSVVEARAALVLDVDEANNNTTISTPDRPDRKQPAYANFPAHLLGGGVSPLPPPTMDSRSNSMQSVYTTATAASGGESFRTGPTIPPDAHLLRFKHQVQDFEPSFVLSSRHIQPVQPQVAPVREDSSNSVQSIYTTATAATSGGESFRTRPTIPPDAHLLRFKHQVQDFEPPSVVLSSRHIQPVQPDVAPVRQDSSSDPRSEYDSFFSQRGGGFTEGATPTEQRAIEAEFQLSVNGFPDGLARHLVREVKSIYPVRFWCIDNSASMFKDDCRRFVHDETDHFGSGPEPTVKCTRWTELQETVKYHANLAGIMGATTVFRLLNHYSNAPIEYVVNRESDTGRVLAILDEIQPDGVSLLTQHVSSVSERIQSIEHNLRQQGQKVVVVLATDGLPSDQFGESTPAMQEDFINALKQLQLMPVWIVIRLCTTDRNVLNFYRRLDKELERPVDVIGGFLTEAREVARLNKWLNYAMPLHRAREMGLTSRLPDLLDERQLTKDEFREMAELLFDKDSLEAAPNVHTDWLEFVKYLQDHVLPRTGQQWNPETKRVECWIDCGKLKTAYGEGLRRKKEMFVLGMQRAFSKDVI